ncbi:hypothetical protein [Chromobacterium phragmitis]|uniref:Lipoprotein n=1 Tax=Chromobacterium phragmitis TaxID=2202141 RepID=A0ABV0IV02_9NEIS
MASRFCILFFLLLASGCGKSDKKDESDFENVRAKPVIYVKKTDSALIFDTSDGVKEIAGSLGGEKIKILTISVTRSRNGVSDDLGWVVVNNSNPLENCSVELPTIFEYGKKFNSCLEVRRADKYDKSFDYKVVVTGFSNKEGEIEFSAVDR